MERHWKLTDEAFEERFSTGKFRPLWFTHEAHVRLAWIYITKYGATLAFQKYSEQLYEFAIKYNATSKYNATVTYAAIKIVAHYIQKSASNNFKDFITEFPQLRANFKELLAKHYSSDIFTSEIAKKTILEPDLIPFE